MRYISFIVMASILFLSGCASTSQGVSGDYRLDAQNSKGLVVVAARLDRHCGTGMNTFELDYRNSGTGEYAGFFLLNNMFMKNDYKDPAGFFYVRELPAGRYVFSGISDASLEWSGGAIQPPIRFHVEPGRALYLGEITVTFVCNGPGKLGYVITIKDERKRDAELFDARMTNLSSKDLGYSIMNR